MKTLLKKLFFTDAPAQGVFAGFTLLLAAFWIVPALILLQGDFPLNFVPFRATFFNLGCQIGILFAILYALTVWIRFYFRRQTEEIPWNAPGRLTLYAVGLLSVVLSGWIFVRFLRAGHPILFLTAPAVLVLLIAMLWIPLFLYPKQWKIILARGMCLSAAIGCSATVMIAMDFSILWFFHCYYEYFSGPAKWLHPAAFAAVFLWILAYVLTAWMYAQLAQTPIRKIFSRAAVIILGLWAGVYLISLGMAYAAHNRTDRTMAELEKHFGQPLSLEALNAAYCQNRPVDEAFWQQIKSCIEQSYPSDKKTGMDEIMISGTPEGIYPESTFRQFKSAFEQSEPRKIIEQMLNRRRLPARKLRILRGDITCLDLSELNWCRDICRWELWRIRFALADGKRPDACAAMERMKRVTDYLGNRTNSLLTILLLIACERYRMLGFERLLASGQVPDELLKQWAAELERDEKAVPGLHFDTVYAEAVFANSVIRSAAHGGTDSEGKVYPGLYVLRYLYPPLWYYCTLDRNRCMRSFKVRSFGEMDSPEKGPGILRKMLFPLQSADKKIMVLTANYRAMRALIGVELEKRRTGRYPDKLENPPADPFTGKPMFYKKGKMPLIVKVWDPAVRRFVSEKREADGIAVWSLGPNRKNEQGQEERTVRKYADDVRAKMVFKKDSRD